MKPQIISFEIGYGNEMVAFRLGLIRVKEESDFIQRFVDIADDDVEKAEKEYQIFVDSLAQWSVEKPQSVELIDGKKVYTDLFPDAESPAASIRGYFGEKTVEKEWIADYAIRAFRGKLQPTVRFRGPSE